MINLEDIPCKIEVENLKT